MTQLSDRHAGDVLCLACNRSPQKKRQHFSSMAWAMAPSYHRHTSSCATGPMRRDGASL